MSRRLRGRAAYAGSMQTGGDLTREELEEIEGDTDALLRDAKEPDDVPPVLERVCLHLTGGGPQIARMRSEGRARLENRTWRVQLRMDVLGTPRGRHVMGHEIAHIYAAKVLRREVSEEWCDAFGAVLAAPRRAMTRAMRLAGDSPKYMAEVLEVEPELALLRVGEASGRPVLLERRRGVFIHRGEECGWPPRADWFGVDRRVMHPVKVGARWGLMRAV